MTERRLADNAAITFLQENPKRANSKAHERYEKYKGAKTVAEALRLGAVKGDIPNDLKKGHLVVVNELGAANQDSSPQLPQSAVVQSVASLNRASPVKRGSEEVGDYPLAKRPAVEVPSIRPPQPVQLAQSPQPVQLLQPLQPVQPVQLGQSLQPVQPPQPAQLGSVPPPVQPVQPLQFVEPAQPPQSAQLLEPVQPGPPAADSAHSTGPLIAAVDCVGTSSSSVATSAPSVAPGETAAAPQGIIPTPQGSKLTYEADLTFAKLDGKPLKFVRRVMGEAKKLLSERGIGETQNEGLQFSLKDRDNLSKYAVTISQLNEDGQLFKDLQRLGLDASIDLELCLPDGYPLSPPFVRVLYPQLTGGYVFQNGGICFEPLTEKGWAASMTIPALCIAIKAIFDHGDVRVSGAGNKELRTVAHYTEAGARKDHNMISRAHHGGDARTYQKNMKS